MTNLTDGKFHELLYRRLPQVYRTEDLNAKPVSLPLKRFLQIASVGMEDALGSFKELDQMYDIDKVDQKYLPSIGRTLGFDIPPQWSAEEARMIIKNLPDIYKVRGSDDVLVFIGRILFGSDAKVDVKTTYTETSVNKNISIQFHDGAYDISRRQSVFAQLVERYRAVNTGVKWEFEIKYIEDFNVVDMVEYTATDYIYDHSYKVGLGRLNSQVVLSKRMEVQEVKHV